jgi:hypothetical protein
MVTATAVVPTAVERAGWAAALLDGGDPGAAADEVVAALLGDEAAPGELLAVARRFTGAHARAVLRAAIDGGRVNAVRYDMWRHPLVVGAFVHHAVGSDEAEDELLRAVLVTHQSEARQSTMPARLRVRRIAAVLGAFSDAHRDEAVLAASSDAHRGGPERLDRWAAILGDTDRPRLAGAASLLAPLGLAEVDLRCGGTDTLEEAEVVPLARALAEAGRLKEALDFAARFEPRVRQEALAATAQVVTGDRDARAVVAAFRACPKGGRDRDQQMTYQHRFARVLLALGRVDDALGVLVKMRDCRISSFGPAPLAWEVVCWFDKRRDEADPQRLRTVLDALASPNVIPQELAPCVSAILRELFVLGDPTFHAELLNTHAARLRARLQSGDRALVDAGLAAGLVAVGRADEAPAFLRDAVASAHRGQRIFFTAQPLIEAAVDAGLVERDPDLFAEVFGTLTARASRHWVSPKLAVRLGPAPRRPGPAARTPWAPGTAPSAGAR